MEDNKNLLDANASNIQTPPSAPSVDYEQEYKKLQLEIEKYKKLKDDYAKESANYKKQLADKMTDEEKLAEAQKELIKAKEQIENELKQLKLEKEILASGFSQIECEKLMKGNMSVSTFAQILKDRLDENTKSVKASMIKESTPNSPLGNGTTTDPNAKSDFKKFQEEQFKKSTSGKVEL